MALRGQVEPQQKVFSVPPISADGCLDDIHPMRRGGVKSFVDDLVLGRGVVISRAATSLRSVETQPLTRRFVRIQTNNYLRLVICLLALLSLVTSPRGPVAIHLAVHTHYSFGVCCSAGGGHRASNTLKF